MKVEKNQKSSKGVTLIALVITIIVLLILAGISIMMLTGQNGILNRAQEAKEKTKEAEKEETESLGDMEDIINEYTTGITVEQVTDQNPGVLEIDETDVNTYIINSIEDLVFFAYNVREGNTYSGKTIELGINLDFNSDKSYVDPLRTDYEEYGYTGELKKLLTTDQGWISIGNTINIDNQNFEGTFDGKNKVIKNLYMNKNVQEESYIGFFANNKGTIQNFKILNEQIELIGKDNIYIFFGSICGNNEGSIINCETSGEISMEASYGLTGGIGGKNEGNIKQSRSNNKLYCKTMYAGGIVGQNLGNLESCMNLGEISVEKYGGYVGGITGLSMQSSASIISSCNTGNIYVKTEDNILVGGIAGQIQAKIMACYNTATINIEADDVLIRAGGIVGISNNILKNSYNLGSICLNGIAEGRIGGITGQFDQGTVQYSYNEGLLSSDNTSNIGGIIGYVKDDSKIDILSNNYYLNNIEKGIGYILNDNQTYTTIKEKEMDKNELCTLLNTDCNLWKNDKNNLNNGYPILEWQ